ncbi:EAL domain-containing protein [Coralliovum pocilloporae]|uniref:EAL domain-containing protein n=1 Tax=Coralliovum pocilloporae TaxID=3066369 RepID=UPI003306A2E3
MARTSAFIIGLSMVVIAASVGLVLHMQYGLSVIEALLASTLMLLALVLFNSQFQRSRDRERLEEKLDEVRLVKTEQDRALEDIRKELAIFHQTLPEHIRHNLDPLTAEVEVFGTLIRQLAETMAQMDARIDTLDEWKTELERRLSAPPQRRAPQQPQAALGGQQRHDAPHDAPTRNQDGIRQRWPQSNPAGPDPLAATLRRSIAENRIDLHLQPIVTLPQRQVFAYEALTRVRDENDTILMPEDYTAAAEGAGVMPMIDNTMLLKSVQILRRMNQRKRDVSIFCNISAASLINGEFFGNFMNYIEANRELADNMIFEFSHATVREMGPLEYETLSALTDLGFRFSMDQLEDLRFDFRDLNRLGFQFVKVPASKLITGWPDSGSDIHAADLSRLLARNGLEMIADVIENEATVVDVLECDAQYGQGNLFAPPRPVRAEAMRPLERDGQQSRRAAE